MTASYRSEILEAFTRHTHAPKQHQLAALAQRCIPLWGLAGEPGSGEIPACFARVSFQASAPRFEFAEDGDPAMAVVALDAFGEPADIVAWAKGPRIASWWGAVSVLGAQHVAGPRLGGALNVFPEPFAWMRHHRDGIVIVDRSRAARLLRDFGPFRAVDAEHGLELQALLTTPLPEVVVRSPEPEKVAA